MHQGGDTRQIDKYHTTLGTTPRGKGNPQQPASRGREAWGVPNVRATYHGAGTRPPRGMTGGSRLWEYGTSQQPALNGTLRGGPSRLPATEECWQTATGRGRGKGKGRSGKGKGGGKGERGGGPQGWSHPNYWDPLNRRERKPALSEKEASHCATGGVHPRQPWGPALAGQQTGDRDLPYPWFQNTWTRGNGRKTWKEH